MKRISLLVLMLVVFEHGRSPARAGDDRAQVPPALYDTYLELGVGALGGGYGAAQFRDVPGYAFESADLEPAAVRLVLGHAFSRHLAVQLSYQRPLSWLHYSYSEPARGRESASVRTAIGGLTLRPRLPVSENFAVFGEVGAGIVSRSGVAAPEGTVLVEAANYVALLLGGGIEYRLDDHWALAVSGTYSPEHPAADQPATSLVTAGLSYRLLASAGDRRQRIADPRYLHPEQWVQVGYSSNVLGYGVNEALEDAGLFWAGDAEVRHGLTVQYQRNVYHGPRLFALDWGASVSHWTSDKEEAGFFTLSVFPVFRFNVLHTEPLDAYVAYSVAGPTYISRVVIDGVDTGEHFTFQDTIGIGVFLGEHRNINAEVRVGHYSNGNIFAENGAVKVPLSVHLGYAF